MSNKGKVFILIFLIIFSLSLTAITFYFFQQERTKGKLMEEELEDLRTRQRVSEMKLSDALKRSSEIDKKLQEANYQIDYLNKELEKEKTSQQDMLKETEQLRNVLKQKEAAEGDLRERLTQSQTKSKNLESQLAQLESEKATLTNRIIELEDGASQGVELGEIVVGPQATAAGVVPGPESIQKIPITSLQAKVLVVNKKYNFAVIDLGSRDGVKFNDTFSVYHGNNYIGDIRVEKVHESMSAAGFLTSAIIDKIKEGDKVVPKQ
jgi:cell shape-determining protein MreC